MSEVLIPEPYYNGNIRTVANGDHPEQEKMRPKTVPAAVGTARHDGNTLFRPASGCRRLNECVQDSGPARNGVYRLPTSHKLQKIKHRRPQSPLEVVSEQPGLRVMKSKSTFVSEVTYGPETPKTAASSETKKGTAPQIDIDEEDIVSGGIHNDFKKIAKLQRSVKMKDAELAIKDKVITQLQQQVDDFQLQLGEERLNHADTKREYDERLTSLRIKKDAERETAIKNLTTHYEGRIEELNNMHENEISDLKMAHARIQKKLEDQVEHLENAFDEFRVSFTAEMELKWKKREDEMRKKIQEETDNRMTSLLNKQQENHSDEIARMKKKHAEEMEVLKHEHESEVNALLRKYKDAYALSEKVSRQQQLIEGLHERLREFEGKLEDTTHQLAEKTREAAELTMRLTAMERDFAVKLQQNADAWQRRLESYISENADIKRLYAFSVHKLSCDRLERDIEMRDRARNASQLANARLSYREQLIEAVLHSRIRTGLPLIPSNPPTEDEERRMRQAQLLRKRVAKLGAAAFAEAELVSPPDNDGRKNIAKEELRQKLPPDVFVGTAGRPVSAPTTDVENFCVFMAAAAAVNSDAENSGGGLTGNKKGNITATS